MAHVKAGGTAKNLRDSKPKMLGVKIYGGQNAKAGSILVRQRGQEFRSGEGTGIGRDHTIFAKQAGIVEFTTKRVHKGRANTSTARVIKVVPRTA
jgi:large subunit ribosomal protein L27